MGDDNQSVPPSGTSNHSKADPRALAEQIYSAGYIDDHLGLLATIITHLAKKEGYPVQQFGFMVLNKMLYGTPPEGEQNATTQKNTRRIP